MHNYAGILKNEIPDNLVEQIILHEEGKLNDDGIIALFKVLIETGLAWQFKGHYGTLAKQLLSSGLISLKEAA